MSSLILAFELLEHMQIRLSKDLTAMQKERVRKMVRMIWWDQWGMSARVCECGGRRGWGGNKMKWNVQGFMSLSIALVISGKGSPGAMRRNICDACLRLRRGSNPRPVGLQSSVLPLGQGVLLRGRRGRGMVGGGAGWCGWWRFLRTAWQLETIRCLYRN